MKKSNTFIDLLVWQKAHHFVLSIYKLTKDFPQEEKYGLTVQFRRAAVSIAANIVEGYRRRGAKDKLKFYNYAQASLEECRYFLILSKDLEYASDFEVQFKLLIQTSMNLNSYYTKIANSLER